jgi:hypothetical protein
VSFLTLRDPEVEGQILTHTKNVHRPALRGDVGWRGKLEAVALDSVTAVFIIIKQGK